MLGVICMLGRLGFVYYGQIIGVVMMFRDRKTDGSIYYDLGQ